MTQIFSREIEGSLHNTLWPYNAMWGRSFLECTVDTQILMDFELISNWYALIYLADKCAKDVDFLRCYVVEI